MNVIIILKRRGNKKINNKTCKYNLNCRFMSNKIDSRIKCFKLNKY